MVLSVHLTDRPAIDHVAVGNRRHRVVTTWRRPEPPTGRCHGAGLLIGSGLGALCWALILVVAFAAPIRDVAATVAWPVAIVGAGAVVARLMVVTRR